MNRTALEINGRVPWLERGVLCVLALGCCIYLWRNRRAVKSHIRDFFTAETSPYNLAIFRFIAFFGVLVDLDIGHIMLKSRMSDSLIFPPRFGWRHVIPYLPIEPDVIQWCGIGLIVFSILGIIGLYTRFSSWMALVLAFFILGVQMFYGKVSHWHHMVWFIALVAASPSGAVLSIDAIFAARKRADAGHVEALQSARVYALPLRLSWILLGIAYFFPGFWKMWDAGLRWAFSDNLKLTMYGYWFEQGRMPIYNPGGLDFMLRSGGLFTMIWEMAFILCVFFPLGRLMAAGMGLVFHNMTRSFLFIPFTSLQFAYFTMIDWPRLLHGSGNLLGLRPCYMLYDRDCRMCRRAVAIFNTMDILGHITYLPMQDRSQLAQKGLGHLEADALAEKMHTVVGSKVGKGFEAYRLLVWRLPVLWPILPFLYIPPIPSIGDAVYRRVAAGRACGLRVKAMPSKGVSLVTPAPSLALLAVAVYLIVGNLAAGIMMETQAWPVACYPTFRTVATVPASKSVELATVDLNGNETLYDWRPISEALWEPILLLNRISHTPNKEQRETRWRDLVTFFRDEFDIDFKGESLRLYFVTKSTVPGTWEDPPIGRELVAEVPLQ